MVEHVKVLGAIGVLRAIAVLVLGVILVQKADRISLRDYDPDRGLFDDMRSDEEDRANMALDRDAFKWVGGVCIAFAAIRLTQAVGAFASARWARAAGLLLAAFDVVNIALFPLSTTLGLYGLVVYRHPETAQRFRRRR